MTKETFIVLICTGLLLMIIALPAKEEKQQIQERGETQVAAAGTIQEKSGSPHSDEIFTYERLLEARVKQILKGVAGVGEVDVLILLKSSEQKIYQTDKKLQTADNLEKDSAGGSRDTKERQEESTTVIIGSSQSGVNSQPLIEKEVRPEVSGIVISAEGGASPAIKNEIVTAMEALFDLPAHKIKVLKRVE